MTRRAPDGTRIPENFDEWAPVLRNRWLLHHGTATWREPRRVWFVLVVAIILWVIGVVAGVVTCGEGDEVVKDEDALLVCYEVAAGAVHAPCLPTATIEVADSSRTEVLARQEKVADEWASQVGLLAERLYSRFTESRSLLRLAAERLVGEIEGTVEEIVPTGGEKGPL